MPTENEIAVRLNEPDKYADIKRENDKFGPGVHVLWGVRDDGRLELQGIRFDRDKFGAKEVGRWLSEHGYQGTIEAGELETPRRLFRKVAVRVGKFKDSDGTALDIRQSDIDHWADTFREFRAAGIDVPLCSDHDFETAATLGQVLDLEVDGDALVATVEAIGQDAIEAALRNNCSIYSPPEYIGGNGKSYAYPILHLAVTPYPLVPGLGRFEPIAASKVQSRRKEALNMDAYAGRIARILGLGEDADEEKVAEAVQALIDKVEELEKPEPEEPVKAAEDEDDEKDKEIEAMKAQVLAARREQRGLRLSSLADAGKISRAVHDKLRKEFVDGATMEGLTSDKFDFVCSQFAENVTLSPGPKTRYAVPDAGKGEGAMSLAKYMETRKARKVS